MRNPQWKERRICEKDGFDIVLSFEDEIMCPKNHFMTECGWDQEQYNEVSDYYWFIAVITAYKGSINCGSSSLGGNCYKSLKCVLQSSRGGYDPRDILSGYFPQLVEEAIEDANTNLTTKPQEYHHA